MPSVVVHACNTSAQETEAGGPLAPGQPALHGEFQTNLGNLQNLISINQN
jgi:hypothetical protein